MASLLKNANPEMLTDPEPLANIEAEQAVLGALLVNNQAMLYVGQLTKEHFYEPLHQRIFTWMLYCWERQIKFDPITMRPRFESDEALINIGGGAYLGNLARMAGLIHNVAYYSLTIIEMSMNRDLMRILNEGRNAVIQRNESPPEIALSITEKIQNCIIGSEPPIFYDDCEVTESILADMKRAVRPYSTGYSKLDEAMDGGLYPGKSYGFAARKKLGKTILAGSIAQNLNENGVRHLFICGEMSPAEVQKRTLGRLLKVKSGAWHSDVHSLAFQKKISEAGVASKKNIIYRNAPGLTFEDLKRYVLLARMQKKITGFILDYWQLVGGKPKGKSTAEHLDEVAQWIADTCRKYDMWSIVMAQINQEGNTRGGEGIRLAFDQVYVLRAPNDDAGRSERWLEMSDTRYTQWRSVGNANNPGFYMNEFGPHFSETAGDDDFFDLGD